MLIQRLSIIGVGLIGGSLARALKRTGVCGEIVGCGRNTNNLQHAIDLGVIDRYDTDPSRAVKDADMVVIAVPVGTTARMFTAISHALSSQTIITDVGSTKATVVADARQHLGQHLPRFVPGHPIAGTEKSGVAASFAELFEDRHVILTPVPETNLQAIQIVTTIWEKTGAKVTNMSVKHHDEILAAISHLPHMLAYSLVNTLAKMDTETDVFQFVAGGFRDSTRIASSDPQMWHDICLANRDAILKILEHFNIELAQLTDAIRRCDSQSLESIFTHAKIVRDKV